MNSEHLFIEDDSLRTPVIQLTRKPGGLDFLFDQVIDPSTSDGDLLIISEMLVYFGGHHELGDEKINSRLAVEVIKTIDNGRAKKADNQFSAPIGRKIHEAADKVQKGNHAAHPN